MIQNACALRGAASAGVGADVFVTLGSIAYDPLRPLGGFRTYSLGGSIPSRWVTK
jgi:hypothetical protein